VKELTVTKKLKVVKLFLTGLSYDDIAQQSGIAKGSVVNIVNEFREGGLPLPPGMTEYIDELRKLVRQETSKSLANKEIFLLRNLSRGKGVGFFENEGFYPDFILWIKEGIQQRVIFVDPHGMLHEKAYELSDKTTLHERLSELSESWAIKTGLNNVSLDSYIISATPYEKLRYYYGDGSWSRSDFACKHILFPDPPLDVDYLKPLFEAS